MPQTTPVYRLPYLMQGDSTEVLTEVVERTRFMTIDRQLEGLFTFLGNGVISGWAIERTSDNSKSITITPGSGVVASVAAATTAAITLDQDDLTVSEESGSVVTNYIYVQLLGHTPYTAKAQFIASTATYDSDVYMCLGQVIVDSIGNIQSVDTSSGSGRTELTIVRYILSIINQHVHTGTPGEPEKIDLYNHVKGVLSAANLEDLDASKITSGTISKERFDLSHSDLSDVGTLSHAEIDSLIENLQKVNQTLFGDLMTANLMQLLLSLKHVWSTVDDYMVNYYALIPGVGDDTFLGTNSHVDINATDAEVDYVAKRIRGKYSPAKEIGQYTINTGAEFNEGDYNSNYVVVTDTGLAYGYGYGYGAGLDYFDVLTRDSSDIFTGTTLEMGFSGSLTGYGTDSFESTFANSYGWGYGWEYATGFPSTLTSTIVTLNPLTSSLLVYDKGELSGASSPNTYYRSFDASDGFGYSPTSLESGTESATKNEFIIQAADKANRYTQGATSEKRRSTLVNPSTGTSLTTNLFSFTSAFSTSEDDQLFASSDKSLVYVSWANGFDMTEDDYVYVTLTQVKGSGESGSSFSSLFDANWKPDHSFDLIIEMTDSSYGLYGARYFYRYSGSDRFIDRDTEYFSSISAPTGITPASTTVSANIVEVKLEFLIGYAIPNESDSSTEFNERLERNPDTDVPAPNFSSLRRNVTGIYLYAESGDGYTTGENNLAQPIIFPQGVDSGEDLSGGAGSDIMRVELDRIYLGGDLGYSTNYLNNKLEDLTITFPDNVDFTSISWISSEPSDSVIYIQVQRNGIQGTSDSGDSDYRTNPIYTNKSADSSDDSYEETLLDTQDIFSSGTDYRISGSDFPSAFDNTRSISLRVVLLPSTDGLIAPVLNSITINYLSETVSGSFTISTNEQWQAARSIQNLDLSTDGEVTIDQPTTAYGRVNNVVYGTDKEVMEYNSLWNTVANRFDGSSVLPTTITQSLNGTTAGLVGYITDLKKLDNGNIIFLDRDASRIIEVDKSYNLQSVVASEFVYLNSDENISLSQTVNFNKAIFNRELGDNGVLYFVFSHELAAWSDGINPGDTTNVDAARFLIKKKGISYDLSEATVTVCDRGILCFALSSTLYNWIEGNTDLEVETTIDSSSSPSVLFKENVTTQTGTVRVSITKVGARGSYTGYNLLYLPIQGIVAFDVDADNNYVILKKSRPYSWDTSDEIWYARFSVNQPWETWSTSSSSDSYLETNVDNFGAYDSDGALVDFSVPVNPNFYLNNTFGNKGSIERNEDYLLISISGDRQLFVFKKNTTTGVFYSPTSIALPSDNTYPMDARFDPDTFETTDYGYIYLALSDLSSSSAGSTGRSRVIKFADSTTTGIEWRWGAGTDVAAGNYTEKAVSVNSVRPMTYGSNSDVVIST